MQLTRVTLCVGAISLGGAAGCVWSAREALPAGLTCPVVYNKGYNIQIPFAQGFVMFDLSRYEKVYNGLVQAGVTSGKTVIIPGEVTDVELRLVHTPEWVKKTHDRATVAEVFESPVVANLPACYVQQAIVGPFRMQTRGTVLAARYALKTGLACTLGGGFSHAEADHGEGFNLFADVPLAIQTLRKDGWKGNVLVLDVDVHHGQGTAKFFRDDPSVFVMDVYNKDNYPYARVEVDVAIELDSGTGDKEYLRRLGAELPKALDTFKPDLVIYVAGLDCHKDDRIGGLALTEDGLFRRDALVIDLCRKRKIPLCITLSGGYWSGSWRPSVRMIEYAAGRR